MHVVQQSPDRSCNRIRHFLGDAVGIAAHALLHLLAAHIVFTLALDDYPARDTHYGCSRRNRLGYHRVGADLRALAHLEWTKNFCTCTNHHAVADGWMTLTLVPAGTAKRYTLEIGRASCRERVWRSGGAACVKQTDAWR